MTLGDYKTNPAKHFPTPESVLDHPSLSSDDKKEILLSWKDELIQLQSATAENMPRLDEQDGQTASLSRVEMALEKL